MSEYKKAREIVYDMCKGGKNFKMSIPPQPEDSDNILCSIIDSCEQLEQQLQSKNETILKLVEALEELLDADENFYLPSEAIILEQCHKDKAKAMDRKTLKELKEVIEKVRE